MDRKAQQLLEQVDEAQGRFRDVLARAGLTEGSLVSLGEALRRRLPGAELESVEAAKRAHLPVQRSRRPGTSTLVVPPGIKA